MKVDDYKWCAQKHLKTCSRMLDYYKSSLFSDNSATEQEKVSSCSKFTTYSAMSLKDLQYILPTPCPTCSQQTAKREP